MEREQVSILQASFIIITVLGILDHVILMPALLRAAERDAWLSVLAAGLLFMCWIPLVYFIMERTRQQHLIVWMKRIITAPAAWCIVSVILLQLFVMCVTTIRDVSYWANITYLPGTPNLLIVSALAVISYYAVQSGIRTIAIVNGILFPLVVMLGFFVAIANIPHKNYTHLFPLFEHGTTPFMKGILFAGSGLTGLLYFVLMQHRLRTKIKLAGLMITGSILIGLTLGPLMGAIAVFGPFEAARMRFPAYEEWRLVTFGHYIEHIDFLSIYQWLVGSFTRISLGMFLIPDLLDIQSKSKRMITLICLFVLLIACSQIRIGDRTFVAFMSTYYLPYSFLLFLILSLLFAWIAWLSGKRETVA